MGLLNRLFGSTEDLAKEILVDDGLILRILEDYFKTVSEKRKIMEGIHNYANLRINIVKLKFLLNNELVSIKDSERKSSEIVHDLNRLEHNEKIRRIHRLKECLDYTQTRFEYVYRLLEKLYSCLVNQIHIVKRLEDSRSDQIEKLIDHLKSEIEQEHEMIKDIESTKNFHYFFIELVKGEHVIRTMDATEKEFVKRMKDKFHRIFQGEITDGILYEWAMSVYDEVQNVVENHTAVMLHSIGPNFGQAGPRGDFEFEFVNRPQFIELAKEVISRIRKRPVSEQMIHSFVHMFREWYNHGRD